MINYLLEPFINNPNLGYSNELVVILEKLKKYSFKNQLENLCFKPSFNTTENSCGASAGISLKINLLDNYQLYNL